MSVNEELYNELISYKIYLDDIYNNEIDIIRRLKIKVYELGYNISEINEILYNFYRYYEIPDITMDMITNATIYLYTRPDNTNELMMRLISHMNIRSELINTFSDLININTSRGINRDIEEPDDNKLNEEEFNNLEVNILEEDIDNDCSICIDNLKKGNEIIKLGCNHIFHKKCIKSYLLNYDNKCPLCRTIILQKNNETIELPELDL